MPAGWQRWRCKLPSKELNDYLHLEKYKAIFFGEQHNAIFDPQVKYYLITDANKRAGTRHIFIEGSVSNAWHINSYLQTGDTSYLHNASSRNPYIILWEKLYAYNKGLPDSAKLVFYGLDFERTDVFLTLKRLSPAGEQVPAGLQAVMDTINAHIADPPLKMWGITDGKFILYDNSAFVNTLRYVQDQLTAHVDDTRRYYGTNYTVVKDIAANMAPVEVAPKHRNKVMFAAMERIIREQNIGRFIGFFGRQHTTYSAGYSLANMAKGLKGIDAGDILNIGEVAYKQNTTDTNFRVKHFSEIVALNGGCRASLLNAHAVPGLEKEADFVFIADISE